MSSRSVPAGSSRAEAPTDDNPGGPVAEMRGPARRPVWPRHAASLILWRGAGQEAEVLMGLRHAGHRFMPGVLVFPGGRVDPGDYRAAALSELSAGTRAALGRAAPPGLARALAVAAARELQEETALCLGRAEGARLLPDLGALHYICRAVTPPPSPMRFNARFLAAPAEAAHGPIQGSGELETLGFVPVEAAFRHRIAGITAKVLREFVAWLAMTPEERAGRTLICFRGNDDRLPER